MEKERDKELLQQIFNSPELTEVLEKYLVLVQEPDPKDMDLLSDVDAGQFIKTDRRARKLILSRWHKMKALAQGGSGDVGRTVPE